VCPHCLITDPANLETCAASGRSASAPRTGRSARPAARSRQ
jgi:hypothetical protein